MLWHMRQVEFSVCSGPDGWLNKDSHHIYRRGEKKCSRQKYFHWCERVSSFVTLQLTHKQNIHTRESHNVEICTVFLCENKPHSPKKTRSKNIWCVLFLQIYIFRIKFRWFVAQRKVNRRRITYMWANIDSTDSSTRCAVANNFDSQK